MKQYGKNITSYCIFFISNKLTIYLSIYLSCTTLTEITGENNASSHNPYKTTLTFNQLTYHNFIFCDESVQSCRFVVWRPVSGVSDIACPVHIRVIQDCEDVHIPGWDAQPPCQSLAEDIVFTLPRDHLAWRNLSGFGPRYKLLCSNI